MPEAKDVESIRQRVSFVSQRDPNGLAELSSNLLIVLWLRSDKAEADNVVKKQAIDVDCEIP